jgi:hypothetical protein
MPKEQQVAFSNLPRGGNGTVVLVTFVCDGDEYTLIIADETAIWRRHQDGTVEDFDRLYAHLAERQDERVDVDLACASYMNKAQLAELFIKSTAP